MDQIVKDLMVYNDEDDHPAYFLWPVVKRKYK